MQAQYRRPPQAQLAEEIQSVRSRPVLGDPALDKAADRYALERYLPAAMRAVHGPTRGDDVGFGHLVSNLDAKIGKDRAVSADRFANAGVSAKLHPVHVIDEVRTVKLRGGVEVAARADPLERTPSLCALVLLGCGVRVGADRSQIGGGPEQATEQARSRFQTTVVAAATANAVNVSLAAGQDCGCESSGK